MSKLLPLFPLQLVVFPRTQLPLHIFEERYKEMVGEAIRAQTEFGIVLAKDDGIVNAGCTVSVEKVVTEYPDGRLDILTHGVRRFEILFLNQDRPFLQGQVEFFEDDALEDVPAHIREKAVQSYRNFTEAATEVRSYSEPELDDAQLSFQLAQAVPDLDFQSRLLRSRSELERLHALTEFIEEQIPRVRHRERMRDLAPRNGFGHKIAGV